MKKAEKVVSTFTAHDLSCKSDLDKFLDILDSEFKDETIENAYNIYLKFTYLKKQPDVCEWLYLRIWKFDSWNE